MNKKIKIILVIFILCIISVIGYGCYYFNDYYHADKSTTSYFNGNENVSVIKMSNGLFLDGRGNSDVIIFYPGAKVEYTAYLPLFMNLSNQGIDCFIVDMPLNIAFFGENSADTIINNSSYHYNNWYISGHSLGGVVASMYAHDNSNKIKGIILLAAYPQKDVKNMSLLSIYGSNDNVLNKTDYESHKNLMPDNYTEYIINGGNHAHFAYYENQSGDGNATITREQQINETVNKIIDFIKKTSN